MRERKTTAVGRSSLVTIVRRDPIEHSKQRIPSQSHGIWISKLTSFQCSRRLVELPLSVSAYLVTRQDQLSCLLGCQLYFAGFL